MSQPSMLADGRYLQHELASLRLKFEAESPRSVRHVVESTLAELVASRPGERAILAGERAPTFSLPDTRGNLVSLRHLLQRGPLVVAFFRGGWCPFCRAELAALQREAVAIRDLGASLVAISPQTRGRAAKMRVEMRLSFPLLVDRGSEVADAYGVRWVLPAAMLGALRRMGSDLFAMNEAGSGALPYPARFVVAPDGHLSLAEANPDFTRRPDPSDLRPTLLALKRDGHATTPR